MPRTRQKIETTGEIERYVRESQLLAGYLPFSASTLWRKVRSGTFPQPVKLGPKITAWRLSQVNAWLTSQPTLTDSLTPLRGRPRTPLMPEALNEIRST